MANHNQNNLNNTTLKSYLVKNLLLIKWIFITSCVILMINGVFISIGSVIVWKKLQYYENFVSYYINTPILILIIGGVIIIALSWFGIVCAWQSYYRGIFMFYIFTSILFVSTVCGWAYLYHVSDSNSNIHKKYMLHTLVNATKNYNSETDAINILQTRLKCCGVQDYTDWERVLGYIPGSCCGSNDACDYSNKFHIYEQGCYSVLHGLIRTYTLLLYLIVILTEGFFVLSIFLSYYLYQAHKHKQVLLCTQRRNIELNQNYLTDNYSVYAIGPAGLSTKLNRHNIP